jgi:transcriptional regulator with XRE-family HTH domain
MDGGNDTGRSMTNRPIAIRIRAKKLAVLIRAARLAAGKEVKETAQGIGVSSEKFEAFETGEDSPSLPELEALACFLNVPIEQFWSDQVNLPVKPSDDQIDVGQVIELRQHIIGTMLRKARMEADKSSMEIADRAGISEEQLVAYELGEIPVPLPELEALIAALEFPLQEFRDTRSPVARWALQQRALIQFSELEPELQDFISKPVNRPYLLLAKRLSEMSVEKLRMVAEGLLEITL